MSRNLSVLIRKVAPVSGTMHRTFAREAGLPTLVESSPLAGSLLGLVKPVSMTQEPAPASVREQPRRVVPDSLFGTL